MKGGAVSPKTAGSQSKALEVHPGQWIWDGLVKILEVDIFSPAWEVRHGAAMALRELLKAQGKYGGTKGRYSLIRNVFLPHLRLFIIFSWSEEGRQCHRTRKMVQSSRGEASLRVLPGSVWRLCI